MLIGVAASIPVTVMTLEVYSVLSSALVCAVNAKASGVVSAVVVTVKVALTPPTVRVAATGALLVLEDITFTAMVCIGLTVPAAAVNALPSIAYWPLVMLTGTAVSMPVTVMVLEVISLLRAASIVGVKL